MTKPRFEAVFDIIRQAHGRRGVALMGVCNVTPDSFSDGGRYVSAAAATAQVDRLLLDGADIIDIGGESTRPGAPQVAASVQLDRIFEVVRYAAARACVSVDTTLPEVAEACLREGAMVVNDVSSLAERELARVVKRHEAAFILMHARGPQDRMAGFSDYPAAGYTDVTADVIREWTAAAATALDLGLPRGALMMDPGLGFSKNAQQSATLLRQTKRLVAGVSAPVVIGASRKSFLREIDPEAGPNDRMGASIGAAILAARAGAMVVRVHDVRETRQALDALRHFGGDGHGAALAGASP